jgi:hypothetical protein
MPDWLNKVGGYAMEGLKTAITPLVDPETANVGANVIDTSRKGPTRGGFFDAMQAIPEVARNLYDHPLDTTRGYLAGGVEGLATMTDPVTLATLPLGGQGRAVSGGARAAAPALAGLERAAAPVARMMPAADDALRAGRGIADDALRGAERAAAPKVKPSLDFDPSKVRVTEPRGPGYRQRVLNEAGEGTPGLSMEMRPHPANPGQFRQNVVYRDPQGSPVMNAILERLEDGKLAVGNLASMEGGGLLNGRALKAITNRLSEIDALRPFSGVSPDVAAILERMAGR